MIILLTLYGGAVLLNGIVATVDQIVAVQIRAQLVLRPHVGDDVDRRAVDLIEPLASDLTLLTISILRGPCR